MPSLLKPPRIAAGVLAATAALTVAPGAASAATVKVACLQLGVSHLVAKPSRCAILTPGKPASSGADLWSLRWKSWGKKTATATGIDQAFRSDGTRYRVKVTATGRRGGVYRKVVVDYGGGITTTYAPR